MIEVGLPIAEKKARAGRGSSSDMGKAIKVWRTTVECIRAETKPGGHSDDGRQSAPHAGGDNLQRDPLMCGIPVSLCSWPTADAGTCVTQGRSKWGMYSAYGMQDVRPTLYRLTAWHCEQRVRVETQWT